jgi:lysozyme family protein
MASDRFEICWPYVLAQECPYPNDWSNPKNFSNDKHDPGGATMCGIIQREYDVWRTGHSQATQPVEKITQDEGEAIYTICYWQSYCPICPPGVDLVVFDTRTNMGTTEAIKILQVALDVKPDGLWGPLTNAALKTQAPKYAVQVIERFEARRLAVYKQIPGFKYFGDDWTRRNQEISAAAEKMAGAKP